VRGAHAGLLFGFYLSHAGGEMLQDLGFPVIYFPDVSLAKIASHK
jgi:hypothetical protein